MAERYAQISPKAYEHPADRAATSALHAVPLLDTVIKRLTDVGHERRLRQMVMGNAVRLGERQVPEVWRSYVQCASALDLDTVPDLYVANDPETNAMTIGARTPIVVVKSSLVASYDAEETRTVLAHEAGHVLSEHNVYTTALVLLQQFLEGALPKTLLLGLPARGMYLALLEWARAAELSCDRASALVMWVELKLTHPFAVRRVRELMTWVQSGEYDRIRSGSYPRRGQEPPPSAEFDAAVAHYRARFSAFLERTAGDVERLGRQLRDWLKRRPEGTDA
ncbi:MAG: M48 family metallopeptidase [Acidimicrobiales bacterium]